MSSGSSALTIVALIVGAIVTLLFRALGFGSDRERHGRLVRQVSELEREKREIRAILKGTHDAPKSHASPASYVADRTVRFACAECGELTPSNELEVVKGRRLCAACREDLPAEESTKTYRE